MKAILSLIPMDNAPFFQYSDAVLLKIFYFFKNPLKNFCIFLEFFT